MSLSLKITGDLQTEIGTHSADLMRQVYSNFDAWNDATIIPGVKNEITLTKLFINNLIKPWSGTFTPTVDAVEFKPRKLSVKVGKAELKVIPEDYRSTYLAQFMKPGVARTPEDLPFARYILEDVFAKIGEELNTVTAYNGVYNGAGTAAVDVANGWKTELGTMITGAEVTPTVTGTLTSSDAFTKIKGMLDAIPDKYKVPGLKLKIYLSRATYNKVLAEIRTFDIMFGKGFEGTRPTWFPDYENIVELKPVSWMSGSNRVIITPQDNLVILTDDTVVDLAKINVVQEMWGAQLGIAFAIGFNFASNMIWCNDVV